MTADDRGGFLHRWSRRKSEARVGKTPDDERAPQEDPAAEDVVADTPSHPSSGASPVAIDSTADGVRVEDEAQPLTLQDVQALTRDSDFSPFVTRDIAPEVKNAALKKLFSDPHYNVMDGLDIYIDDYSNLEPLPAPMLRRMVGAQALKMFDAVGEDGNDADAGQSPAAARGETGAVTDQGRAAQEGAAELDQKMDMVAPKVVPEADPATGSATGSAADSTAGSATGLTEDSTKVSATGSTADSTTDLATDPAAAVKDAPEAGPSVAAAISSATSSRSAPVAPTISADTLKTPTR